MNGGKARVFFKIKITLVSIRYNISTNSLPTTYWRANIRLFRRMNAVAGSYLAKQFKILYAGDINDDHVAAEGVCLVLSGQLSDAERSVDCVYHDDFVCCLRSQRWGHQGPEYRTVKQVRSRIILSIFFFKIWL